MHILNRCDMFSMKTDCIPIQNPMLAACQYFPWLMSELPNTFQEIISLHFPADKYILPTQNNI